MFWKRKTQKPPSPSFGNGRPVPTDTREEWQAARQRREREIHARYPLTNTGARLSLTSEAANGIFDNIESVPVAQQLSE